MNPTQFLAATRIMQELQVGTKEAAVLAAVAVLDGSGQSKDIGQLAGSNNPVALSSQLNVLRKKGLIEQVPNPTGWPFYRLTARAAAQFTTNPTNQ